MVRALDKVDAMLMFVGSVVCCVELSDVSLRVCSIVDYRFIGQWYRIKADGWIA